MAGELLVAEELQQRAVAENLGGHPARGAQLVRRGLAKLSAGPESEPESELEPASERVSSPCHGTARDRLVARLLATLAKSTVETSGLQPGLEVMDRAVRWGRSVPDDQFSAFLASQRGLILFRGGRLRDALCDLDDAVRRISDEAGIDKWRVLLNRGALHVERGDIAAARTDLSRSIELARRFGLTQPERISLHNLGCLEFMAGDLPLALRTIDAGIALDRRTGVETQAGIALLDRSRVLLAAGLRIEADETLAQAAAVLSRDRNFQDVGEVELTRGESALLAGDTLAARRQAARARDRFRRHGNERWRRNAELVLLQADLRDGRPSARLLPPAQRLAAEFAMAGFAASARTAWMLAAESAERLGDVEGAHGLARRAGRPRPEDPIGVRLQTRYVLARLDLATGRRRSARRQLVAGLTDLAAYRSQFGSIELQTASAVHGVRLAELDVSVALAGGQPAQVLAAVERSRAASRRLQPVTPPADEVAAGRLAELRQVIDRLQRAQLGQTETDAAQLSRWQHRAGELQRQLRQHAWLLDGSRRLYQPSAVPAVRNAVAEAGATLVCYVESDGHLHAVVMRDGRMRLRKLGPIRPLLDLVHRIRADLDLLALNRLPQAVAAAARRSLGRDLDALDAVVGAPLGFLGADRQDRIIVVPTEALTPVPWGMLPGLRGRPVVVAPSTTAWLRASEIAPAPAGAPVVALAGPDLSRAGAEIGAVAAHWRGADVQIRPRATGADLRAALATPGLVHVAAHGTHHQENPLFSAVRLHAGPVFAYEFDPASTAARQVVLSACDLGTVSPRVGGEALGLTSVLLHLGVQCVVAGVARVNDETAHAVMTRYHAELARGTDSAEALATACDTACDTAVDAAGAHPAPFVCFGAATSHPVPAAASVG